MATLALDTYKLITILKSHGFSEERATGVKEVIEAIDLEHIATE